MKNAVDYFAATMPEPWQVLGLRLRAFSLGHYKLLKRFECAFVADGEAHATAEDLLLGVLVCSREPKEFLRMIESPTFKQDARAFGDSVGIFDLKEKCLMFADYIAEHSAQQPYWEEANEGKTSGAHWAQCLEVTLRSKLGWTSEDIDTHPISKAFADYFKLAESEGMIRLMTADEIAEIAKKEVAA